MIPKFIMLCGLPCSGKSTYGKQLAEKYNAFILSSDELREEMFGDVNNQENNDKLFKELHHRIRFRLYNGDNVIYDATNINYKRRMEFLKSLNQIPCEKIAVIMATPYETCIERNKNRERKVPEAVIRRMYLNFTIPYYYEGWDDIWIEYATDTENSFRHPMCFVNNTHDFNQDNPHHHLSLGQHCYKTYCYIEDEFWIDEYNPPLELLNAALLHDNGKVFTKSFKNKKGELSDIAHYYGHELPGAYNSLFYELAADHLYVAVLIQWHMRPYLAWDKSEKSREKDRNLLGTKLYNDILKLHEADVYAH